jgi:hypothetical protein
MLGKLLVVKILADQREELALGDAAVSGRALVEQGACAKTLGPAPPQAVRTGEAASTRSEPRTSLAPPSAEPAESQTAEAPTLPS